MAEDPRHRRITVDAAEFIRTRDALMSSYIHLSSAMDNAVKAYIDHANAVLAGDTTLNFGKMIEPLETMKRSHGVVAAAGQALALTNGGVADADEDTKGKRKKRAYKARDPNMPKRPMTAYFRYLHENRAPITKEMGPGFKPGDISKEATARWGRLTEEEKEPYKVAYRAALVGYEKEVEAYKAKGGKLSDDDIAALHASDEDAVPDVDLGAEEEDETSEEESDEDENEEEEEAPAPPPKPASPVKETKTPKSALKKGKKVPATPQFSSLNVPGAAAASSSSPELKRKGDSDATDDGKKRKKRKSAASAAAAVEEPAPAAAEAVTEKKAKKEKRKKKGE